VIFNRLIIIDIFTIRIGFLIVDFLILFIVTLPSIIFILPFILYLENRLLLLLVLVVLLLVVLRLGLKIDELGGLLTVVLVLG